MRSAVVIYGLVFVAVALSLGLVPVPGQVAQPTILLPATGASSPGPEFTVSAPLSLFTHQVTYTVTWKYENISSIGNRTLVILELECGVDPTCNPPHLITHSGSSGTFAINTVTNQYFEVAAENTSYPIEFTITYAFPIERGVPSFVALNAAAVTLVAGALPQRPWAKAKDDAEKR
jgi:uncharacterized membrane protein